MYAYSVGIESQHGALVTPDSKPKKPDEREFEHVFTEAGMRAWDAIEGEDKDHKHAMLNELEQLFEVPDVQKFRLPGEDEVFEGYGRLCEQLGEKPKFSINDNGDIVPLQLADGES